MNVWVAFAVGAIADGTLTVILFAALVLGARADEEAGRVV